MKSEIEIELLSPFISPLLHFTAGFHRFSTEDLFSLKQDSSVK